MKFCYTRESLQRVAVINVCWRRPVPALDGSFDMKSPVRGSILSYPCVGGSVQHISDRNHVPGMSFPASATSRAASGQLEGFRTDDLKAHSRTKFQDRLPNISGTGCDGGIR
jgi:hypothetical protein